MGAMPRQISPAVTGAWVMRLLWAPVPFTVGAAVGDALTDASRAMQIVATVGLWLGWAMVLACTLVLRTTTLTALRIAAPVPLGLALAALADGGAVSGIDVIACAHGAAVVLVAMTPTIGATFVDGSSYGDERRLPLRPPAALVLGPIELAWALIAAPAVVGPALLAARSWIAGTLVVAIGLLAARRAIRSLHALSQRWLVLVPSGLVVHDPLALAEPVLLRRSSITRFAPAASDSTALDLTGGALGLALEVALNAPIELALVEGRQTEVRTVDGLLVSPTQPATVLAAAGARGITI
jgi:hypothetical protein